MLLPSAFSGIDRLDPAEVRMLVTGGRTGARAMMGKLMELVSRGFQPRDQKKPEKQDPVHL